MDYGRGIINFQNQITGRPYARGGTGGIGATAPVRAVAWLFNGSSFASIQQAAQAVGARVIGPVPGFESIQQSLAIVEGPNVLALGGFARVYPITDAAGRFVYDADALVEAETILMRGIGIIDRMDDTVTEVLRLQTAEQRAQWYRDQLGTFTGVIEGMRAEVFIPLAIRMAIIKASPPNKRYSAQAKDVMDLTDTFARRMASIGTQMASWQVEAEWQARNAANRSIWSGYVELANAAMNFFRTAWRAANAAAEAAEDVAKGAKTFIEDANAATKAGLGGIAAIVGVGLVALLFIGGRKK